MNTPLFMRKPRKKISYTSNYSHGPSQYACLSYSQCHLPIFAGHVFAVPCGEITEDPTPVAHYYLILVQYSMSIDIHCSCYPFI